MPKIKRLKGKTIIDFGKIKIKTNQINRHDFNVLRKYDFLTPNDFFKVIKQFKKGKK